MSVMRVPHFLGHGQIGFRDLPRPSAGAGQLLIQVQGNAVCASEVGFFRGGTERVPGHEAAGIVAEAGAGTHTAVERRE